MLLSQGHSSALTKPPSHFAENQQSDLLISSRHHCNTILRCFRAVRFCSAESRSPGRRSPPPPPAPSCCPGINIVFPGMSTSVVSRSRSAVPVHFGAVARVTRSSRRRQHSAPGQGATGWEGEGDAGRGRRRGSVGTAVYIVMIQSILVFAN